jgi:hypothetical protein
MGYCTAMRAVAELSSSRLESSFSLRGGEGSVRRTRPGCMAVKTKHRGAAGSSQGLLTSVQRRSDRQSPPRNCSAGY